MYFSPVRPVFPIVVWLQVAVAYVEPPTNVTLQCHNLHNVLRWNYDKLSPGLRFRVNIGSTLGSPAELWVEPPDLQVDLSFLSKPDNDYYVIVSAVVGENESASAPLEGITFSYFKDSPAMQKCFVDLPPVNVTTQPDNSILFRFTHPWLYLKKQDRSNQKLKLKRHNLSSDHPVFKYDVDTINQKPQSFRCVTDVCEGTFVLESAQETSHCLKITGELKEMSVKAKQLYCAMPYKDHITKIFIYTGVSLMSFIAVVLVFIMVYRKKTSASTPLPHFFPVRGCRQQEMAPQKEILNPVTVEPTSPTPLLSVTDMNEFTSPSTPPNECDLRFRIRVSGEDEGICDVDQVNDEGPGYMHGRNLEEDERLDSSEDPSDYMKRQVLADFGPDERAEGNRG